MSEIIVGVLVLLSVIFLVLEIFLFPGISVCGLVSVAFGGVAVWYAFQNIGLTAGLITVVIWLVVLVLGIWTFVRSKALDKMSLNTQLNETQSLYDIENVHEGEQGVTVSRLAPMGKVRIGGHEYEAKSEDGFIDQKTEVVVVGVEDNHLIVKLKE
ncbi:MAG: serine protease [Paludibacteraceae bacterium]|nr:serine protease [Paludibacteraceae bacterium]